MSVGLLFLNWKEMQWLYGDFSTEIVLNLTAVRQWVNWTRFLLPFHSINNNNNKQVPTWVQSVTLTFQVRVKALAAARICRLSSERKVMKRQRDEMESLTKRRTMSRPCTTTQTVFAPFETHTATSVTEIKAISESIKAKKQETVKRKSV